VRLASGRELAVRPQSLVLSGAAGTLPVGSRVVLAGLAKAPALNGREGGVVGLGEAGSGRLLVDLGEGAGPPKALRTENLVLKAAEPAAPAQEDGEGAAAEDKRFVSEKERAARQERKKAAELFPVGSRVRIHGLVEEKGRDNTGDVALNGEEGVVEGADPDEPGRLIVKVDDTKVRMGPNLKESKLKSLSYENLTWTAWQEAKDSVAALTAPKRAALEGPGASGATLSVVGANGKRCKIAESALSCGDKTVAFASAARDRSLPPPTSDAQDGGVAQQNALIYARTDAVSPDDEVAGAALARLVQLSPDFAMKAVCVLGLDVAANGSGKVGSRSAETILSLAAWLTGRESDGVLRKRLKAGEACAGAPDGIAACRECTEKGLKGGRLLGLLRKSTSGLKEFVARGCRER